LVAKFKRVFITCSMITHPEKEPIPEKLEGSRTAHLQPLIDFLKAQGNTPWPTPSDRPVGADGFEYDRDGFGTFYFEQPLDLLALAARFELPDTITVGTTAVYDRRNFAGLSQGMHRAHRFGWTSNGPL
jgi:hypothetical protein